MAEVYLAARDLVNFAIANHQYILVFLEPREAMPGIEITEENGKSFFTMGGHNVSGNLTYVPNQKDDVGAVRVALNSSLRGRMTDFHLEKNLIPAPTGSGWSFAVQLKQLADRYGVNTRTTPVDYNLRIRNCSTWANTLLKAGGVSLSVREANRDFRGVDWGEHLELDENLFK